MKYYSIFLKVFTAVLVFVASTGISSFCWVGQYEPDVPKALKEKAL
ncbi:MAG: cyclic lactone autoinducer peptide [Syntrophomonas sp.]